jgi:hypothetical protein
MEPNEPNEPNEIEKEPRKWKKDEWKSLPPEAIDLIKMCRAIRIAKLEWKALHAGIDPVYPSDDDDLQYKETKDA